MEKTLVQLHVPAADLLVDALIPESISVDDVIALLTEATEASSRGFFKPTGFEVVCVERLGIPLVPGTNIKRYGLITGDRLILI